MGVIIDGGRKGENCPAKEGLIAWGGLTPAGKRGWIIGEVPDREWGSEDVQGPSTKTAEVVESCPLEITGVWPCRPEKNVGRRVTGLRVWGRTAGQVETADCTMAHYHRDVWTRKNMNRPNWALSAHNWKSNWNVTNWNKKPWLGNKSH